MSEIKYGPDGWPIQPPEPISSSTSLDLLAALFAKAEESGQSVNLDAPGRALLRTIATVLRSWERARPATHLCPDHPVPELPGAYRRIGWGECEHIQCAHCGDYQRGSANVGLLPLCHPDSRDELDCYHLVTCYREPIGSRMPGLPTPGRIPYVPHR